MEMQKSAITIATYFAFYSFTEATECLKNDDIGWRTGNIYSCVDPDKPVCCEMQRKFTCCEIGHTKILRGQVQIWGTVLVVVLVMCIVYIYLKKDIQVFSRPTIQDSVHHYKSKFNSGHREKEEKGCSTINVSSSGACV